MKPKIIVKKIDGKVMDYQGFVIDEDEAGEQLFQTDLLPERKQVVEKCEDYIQWLKDNGRA